MCFSGTLTAQSKLSSDSLPGIPKRFVELSKDFPNECIVKGNSDQKMVGLTFDDGPTALSRRVVELLGRYDAKATFFWLGQHVEEHAQFVLKAALHHQIENHSWDHANGWESSPEKIWKEQLLPTMEAFEQVGLSRPTYYRPPFGAITSEQLRYLGNHGIKTVLWSLTTLDWDTTRNSSSEIYQRFESALRPGSIVLMHDQAFNDNGEQMLQALEQILIYGKKEGYQFVTINELTGHD